MKTLAILAALTLIAAPAFAEGAHHKAGKHGVVSSTTVSTTTTTSGTVSGTMAR